MSSTVGTEVHELLQSWLPDQRWFAGRGRDIHAVAVESSDVLLDTDDVLVRHLVMRVDSTDGSSDWYQLLIGNRSGELPTRLGRAVIGVAEGTTLYDATHDTDATSALLRRIAAAQSTDTLTFSSPQATLDPTLTSRVIGAEQSNTSIVYGEDYILKFFRRLTGGLNPDLEVTRALAGAGSPHIASPLAWIDGQLGGETTTFAMLQPFFSNASEGWAMATASVRDLFGEADLHADEVGGDFAGESERLGMATADVHLLLQQTLPAHSAGPQESQATSRQLAERLEAGLVVVAELAPHAEALRAVYAQVGALTTAVPVQRIHGDLHLGQVLRTLEGWFLLDFEGEPSRPLAERTALMSPLRDVAGMLRSYDYAARHLLAERPTEQHLAYRAEEWAQHNRAAFCTGYARVTGADPREQGVLLKAFELDKAVYEAVYEARHRPSWLPIPLGSIARIMEQTP